jgi:hypothetical protein
MLQTHSLLDPLIEVQEFDYSAFERFWMPVPVHLKHLINDPEDSKGGLHLGRLLGESIAFPQSEVSPGLQLVDAVANTFTGALNGRLAPDVWRRLGSLLVQRPMRHGRPDVAVRLLALGGGPDPGVTEYHTYVLKALSNRAKPMFL